MGFLAKYDERYRSAWGRVEPGPSSPLILRLQGIIKAAYKDHRAKRLHHASSSLPGRRER